LILERKAQEGFWIDGRIYVKVLITGPKRVKLGIEAPSNTKVLRGELMQSGPAPARTRTRGRPATTSSDARQET
jgi:carbon storage regulator CsrA